MSVEDRHVVFNLVVVLGVLVVFAVAMFFAAKVITGASSQSRAESGDSVVVAAIEERIRPVVTLDDLTGAGAEAAPAAAAAPAEPQAGDQVYALACQSCHAAGVLGAPKIGDEAAWSERMAKGYDQLVYNAINGINSMPAKGGLASLQDIEVERAVVHMLEESGVSAGGGTAAAPAPAEDPVTATPAPTESPSMTSSAPEPTAAATRSSGDYAPLDPPADARLAIGKSGYRGSCFACHDAGVAGAPRLGDPVAWTERVSRGADALYEAAIRGRGAMPPKGGAMHLSDDEVRAIVDYMVAEAG